MTTRVTIAEALKSEMLKENTTVAWAGEPDLLLSAYSLAGGRVTHPLDRIEAVIAAARRSKLFVKDGYIRACDSSGRREILHPCFKLAQPVVTETIEGKSCLVRSTSLLKKSSYEYQDCSARNDH